MVQAPNSRLQPLSILLGAILSILIILAPAGARTIEVPGDYDHLQDAVNAALHGDEIVITDSETYDEQVTIVPHGEGSANAFHITLRASNWVDPPRVTHGANPGERDLYYAVIRIQNVKQCRDMRVTIQNLEIVGTGNYTAALSIKDGECDVDHEYNTGLFLDNNSIYSKPNLHQYASVYLGTRYPETPGHELERRYDLTSLKWGEITNNTIIGGDLDMDAISAWHFTGIIANNIITSTQEGCHLSYARIEDDTRPTFVPEQYEKTLIKHNLFVCNNQNALHFTHGSVGEICNNLFIRTWKEDNDPRDSSIGLHVGPGCVTDCDGCPPDSSECYDEDLSDLLGKTYAAIHNNVADKNQGPGIMIHSDATWTELYGNIFSRSCSIFGTSTEPCAGLQARDNQTPPQKPEDYSSYNNLLWNNINLNEQYVDYLPDGPGENTMKGEDDKNHETGDNHPHFEGAIGSPVSGYSYMLQHAEDDPNECYEETGTRSWAIDYGPDGIDYYDQQPPGLDEATCDIGAYGGPRAKWSDSDPCLEYIGLPPQTKCN